MPLFTIELPDKSKRIVVKADTLSTIISNAIRRFNLPDNVYKIVESRSGAEIEDDEVLLELWKNRVEVKKEDTLLLKITPEDFVESSFTESRVRNDPRTASNLNFEIETVDDNSNSTNEAPSTSGSENNRSKKTFVLNFQEGVWSKVSESICIACEKGQRLKNSKKEEIVRIIADYMINDLVDSTESRRSTAMKFATILCHKYPDTFNDRIGNEKWGDGTETLRNKICNCVQYKINATKEKTNVEKSKPSTDNCQESLDSDDEEKETREQEESISRRQDSYGCVDYAPQSVETSEMQEEKRLRLVELFNYVADSRHVKEVTDLMNDTYPTQRGIINVQDRNLAVILTEWPFLKITEYLIQHASRLLGKNVSETWNDSLKKKCKSIRLFFKIPANMPEHIEEVNRIFADAKKYMDIRKDKIPKVLVVFPLLLLYFQEKESFLYKIIPIDQTDTEVLNSPETDYPLLIIRGASLYDATATFTVVFERKILIFCNDALQGILINFILYYVFGYVYPPEAEKCLEFIQRFFFKIHPKMGSKGAEKKKRRQRPFDSTVFKLAHALSHFSDEFRIPK